MFGVSQSKDEALGKNFALFIGSRLLASLAIQMQSVAVGYQVYDLTHNFFYVALIGLAQFAPFFVLIFPAGQVADRLDRRHILSACGALQLACCLFLLGFSLFGSQRDVRVVFLALVLFGTARAFMMPAQQAILANLVPAEKFGRAVALSSSSTHVAVIIGPVLGGVLYLAGPIVVYSIVAVLLLIGLVSIRWVRSSQVVQPAASRKRASTQELLEGLRFVWSRPIVLGALSLDLFAVLLGGAVALLPAYSKDVLALGSTGLGLLRTAPGAGAALTSLVLAFRPLERRVGFWMFGGVALFGIATIGLGVTNVPAFALLALFLTGVGDMVSVYVRHILVQLSTPDGIRGRVSAVNGVFIGASNELGEFESGLTAGWFGLLPAIVAGGAATLVVTVVWARLFPVLSRMDRFPSADERYESEALAPAPAQAVS